MQRVIIESPYAGDISRHVDYLRLCMADSLRRGEAPYASHGLYTQPNVLDDTNPEERALGIAAGFVWREVADATVVYVDMGVSGGMRAGIKHALDHDHPIKVRALGLGNLEPVDLSGSDALVYLVKNGLYPSRLDVPRPIPYTFAARLNQNLVVISGPSGAGKSTVCRALAAEGARQVVGWTSRAPRDEETHGVHYLFEREGSVAHIIAHGETIGWTIHDGALYAYHRRDFARAVRGGTMAVADLTPAGLAGLRAAGLDPVCVWLDAPDWVLRGRMQNRGDSPDHVARRMAGVERMRHDAKRLGYSATINTGGMASSVVVDGVLAIAKAKTCKIADG